MNPKDLDPNIDYSFFSSEDIIEPMQHAIDRIHCYNIMKALNKDLAEVGMYHAHDSS